MKLFTKVSTPLCVNTYVLIKDGNAVMIDPSGRAQYLLDIVARENATLKGILLTHGHFDHTMAVDGLLEQCNVPVYLHSKDIEAMANPDEAVNYYFRRKYRFTADRAIEDGEKINVGGMEFEVIHTPGHTAGSVCYLIGKLLFSGDTILDGTVGRWDFPYGDVKALKNSVDRLLRLDHDLTVYPGHESSVRLGDNTVIGTLL